MTGIDKRITPRNREWLILGLILAVGAALAIPLGSSNQVVLFMIGLATAGIVYMALPTRGQIYILVALAVYFQLLQNVTIPLSNSNIHLLDIFLGMALMGWIARWALGLTSFALDRGSLLLLAGILLILIIPIGVGLANGHVMASVLRDARVPIYYVTLTLLTVSTIRRSDDIVSLLVGMLVVVLPAVVYYYISWALHIPTEEGAAAVVLSSGRYLRYGLLTSWEYILLSWLACVSLLLVGKVPNDRRVWILGYLLLTLVPLLTLLVRGLYLGMLGGLAVIAALSHWIRNPQRLILALVGSALVVTTLLAVDASAGSGLLRAVTERAASIVDPAASTAGSAANRETRLQATQFLVRSTTNPFIGEGYGDGGTFSFSRNAELQLLFRHSVYSWLFYRIGLVQSVAILGLFAYLAWRAARRLWNMENTWLRGATLAFLANLVASFLVGLGNNTVFDFFGVFSVQVIVSMAVLLKFEHLQRSQAAQPQPSVPLASGG